MKTNFSKRIFNLILAIVLLSGAAPAAFQGDNESIDAARSFAQTVLKYGRYLEGSAYPELLVMGFSVDTLKPVEWTWSSKTYNPANFFATQNFLRTLVGLTNITGDSSYKEIAKKQVKLWFENFTDKNGLIYTGMHTFVDAKTGEVVTTGYHEMKNETPYYELMYEVDPEATVKYMEAFWNAHILDWNKLSMNRHGAYDKEMGSLWDNEYTDTSVNFKQDGVAFQSTGNDLIEFALFISRKTGDKRPEQWALRLLQKYIDVANPKTGLSGAQYGELTDGDRAYLQFGEEFGEKAKEYNFVDSGAIEIIAGYTPQVLLPYYESLSDEEKAEKKYILDYVVKTIKGVAENAYDAENNRLKTPMWSDGTPLSGYELKRNGYYGKEGRVFPEYEEISGPLLSSAIYAHKLSGDTDLWEFARSLAQGYGLGDIGTAPGENMNLNMSTTARSGEYSGVMIELYRQTGKSAYLRLAEKIGNNILTWETRVNNMFLKNGSRFNARIGDSNALSLMSIEAAKQGKFGIIPEAAKTAGIDLYHDGVGRVGDGSMIFNKYRVMAKSVSLETKSITIPLLNTVEFNDISACSAEKDIKQMAALGVLEADENGRFLPDNNLTCSEFIKWCARLCRVTEETLTDVNISPDTNMTKEEMGAVVAKALICKNSQITYSPYGTLTQFDDSADISAWARDYCDIAANYYTVNERGDEYFYPKEKVTRAQAAAALKKLSNLIETDTQLLKCSVTPSDAAVRTVTYTSSNDSVAEVDENGRLFAQNTGSAVITAECDGKTDICEISVVPLEAWMIKEIEINGERLEDFSPVKKQYETYLFVDTTELPEISAVSYSGGNVTVIMPKKLPGAAKIYVDGERDNAYFVSLLPEKIDFVTDEDFEDFPLETVPHSIKSGEVTWYLNSSGWENGYAPVRILEYPEECNIEGKAVAMPYIGYAMGFSARLFDKPYITGERADENRVIVIEYDLMTQDAFSGLKVELTGWDETLGKNVSAIQQIYTQDEIHFNGDEDLVVGEYTPGEVHSIKMVINKKTLESDVYIGGEKVLTGQAPKAVTPQIDRLTIGAYAGYDVNTMVYADNIRIYELPAVMDTETPFYDTDNNAITRIGDNLTVNISAPIGEEYEGDTGDLNVICTIYTPEGNIKDVQLAENVTVNGEQGSLNTYADVSNMQNGDYLCVYVWTKERCPQMMQMLIYKC